MTDFKIHDTLPDGYNYADVVQTNAYALTGSVPGASKVCYVREEGDPVLAVKLKPPARWADVVSPVARRYAAMTGFVVDNPDNDEARDWYVTQYNLGWQASRRVGRTGQPSEAWDSGMTPAAWDDGYLDQAAGRPKWHLTYCSNHDECGEA